jgi:hypothetical protein
MICRLWVRPRVWHGHPPRQARCPHRRACFAGRRTPVAPAVSRHPERRDRTIVRVAYCRLAAAASPSRAVLVERVRVLQL